MIGSGGGPGGSGNLLRGDDERLNFHKVRTETVNSKISQRRVSESIIPDAMKVREG